MRYCLRRSSLSITPPNAKALRLTGGALALPVLVLLVACSQPSAQRLNADGNRAFARGEYQPALENYRKAQVERPDLASLNYNAGNALYEQGNYQRAIDESLRATRSQNRDASEHAFYSIGADYYRQGKLKEALNAFKSALRLDSTDLDAKYNVEVIQLQLDREAAQQQQLQQAGQNQPNQGDQQNQAQQPNGSAGQDQQNASSAAQQNAQPGQGQPSGQAAAGNGGAQQSQPSPGGASPGGPGSPGVNGAASPTPGQQQAQLNGDLKDAIAAYDKAPSIDQALHILDILAQQEQLAQAEAGNHSTPGTLDK